MFLKKPLSNVIVLFSVCWSLLFSSAVRAVSFVEAKRFIESKTSINLVFYEITRGEDKPLQGGPKKFRFCVGLASWYPPTGNLTASGAYYDQWAMTAAHKTLTFGSRVKVTNLNNNRSVVVKINDRGPYSGGRIIDLSRGAARIIGVEATGVAPVKLEVVR